MYKNILYCILYLYRIDHYLTSRVAMKNAQLITQSITKSFVQGAISCTVLSDISVHFGQGKTYAITGASGAGKSTLLHILAGIEQPTQGIVLFNDTNIATFNYDQQAQFLHKNIGLVFQSSYLIRELTVIENVMLKGIIAGSYYEECEQKGYALLQQIGLASKASSQPSTLSGGQQQRVAILRALFNEPCFLLADEPTGNLDEQTGNGIIDFLLDCQKEWGMGLIISSHDRYVVGKAAIHMKLHNGSLRL